MTTEQALRSYTWHVAYNDFGANVAGDRPVATTVEVEAAYFSTDEQLILFKDLDHQVVFAIHAGTISTVHRDGAEVTWK